MEKILLTTEPKDMGDIYSCKIISTYNAYKDISNTAFFWNGDNSSYCLWGDNITISGDVNCEFVKIIAPRTVLCSKENADKLNLNILSQGDVMKKRILGIKSEIQGEFLENPKSLFTLLKSCDMADDYEGFLLDTSLKLRKSLGVLCSQTENNKMISAVLSSYICDNSAIITAIATDCLHRKQGSAKKLLEQAEKLLAGRTVFLLKEKEKNEQFYEKMNYKKSGKWVLGEI